MRVCPFEGHGGGGGGGHDIDTIGEPWVPVLLMSRDVQSTALRELVRIDVPGILDMKWYAKGRSWRFVLSMNACL